MKSVPNIFRRRRTHTRSMHSVVLAERARRGTISRNITRIATALCPAFRQTDGNVHQTSFPTSVIKRHSFSLCNLPRNCVALKLWLQNIFRKFPRRKKTQLAPSLFGKAANSQVKFPASRDNNDVTNP